MLPRALAAPADCECLQHVGIADGMSVHTGIADGMSTHARICMPAGARASVQASGTKPPAHARARAHTHTLSPAHPPTGMFVRIGIADGMLYTPVHEMRA